MGHPSAPRDPPDPGGPLDGGSARQHRAPGLGVSLTREDLMVWGVDLGRSIRAPAVVAIEGELGAGKTTLVQAICRGYGVSDDVTSPTFALVHEYGSPRGSVFHLDLYRLSGAPDLTNLAWDDIINSGALVLVEWPDRAGSKLPADAIRLRLAHDTSDPERRVLSSERSW
jgi:tRNA threonylcarbamoyladenosine biosynthesis protein TsaE